MTDMLQNGAAWLAAQIQRNFSQPVVYSRGADSVAVLATFGRKLYKLDDGEGGFRIEYSDRDFLIPAASLVLDGVAVLPRRGDLVTVTEGGVATAYQVLAPGGEPEWQWSDPYRQMLRVHAKRVGGEG